MSGDNTAKKHRGLVQPWRSGQSGNPAGRPKGARNKLGEDFLEALAADFEAHGRALIERVREEYPHYYLKVVASLMTKHVEAKVDNRTLEELTDRELLEMIVAGAGDLPEDMREEFRQMASEAPPDKVHWREIRRARNRG